MLKFEIQISLKKDSFIRLFHVLVVEGEYQLGIRIFWKELNGHFERLKVPFTYICLLFVHIVSTLCSRYVIKLARL